LRVREETDEKEKPRARRYQMAQPQRPNPPTTKIMAMIAPTLKPPGPSESPPLLEAADDGFVVEGESEAADKRTVICGLEPVTWETIAVKDEKTEVRGVGAPGKSRPDEGRVERRYAKQRVATAPAVVLARTKAVEGLWFPVDDAVRSVTSAAVKGKRTVSVSSEAGGVVAGTTGPLAVQLTLALIGLSRSEVSVAAAVLCEGEVKKLTMSWERVDWMLIPLGWTKSG
jgi:hypothetical protein